VSDIPNNTRDGSAPQPGSQTMDISRDIDAIWCSRRCARFAEAVGFADAALWEISIAVSELVTNVLNYAGRGRITIRQLVAPKPGVEITVEDEGPGIEDVERVVVDGYSEGRGDQPDQSGPRRRGLGAGLGAVHRLMDQVTIENRPTGGVRVVASKLLD
jgi:serine/threonine-protein kinase RsbT